MNIDIDTIPNARDLAWGFVKPGSHKPCGCVWCVEIAKSFKANPGPKMEAPF